MLENYFKLNNRTKILSKNTNSLGVVGVDSLVKMESRVDSYETLGVVNLYPQYQLLKPCEDQQINLHS